MGRVAHWKSAKQAASSNATRSSKVAKQRKQHKVVIESDSQDKEKSRAVLSFHADPPPGYTFIPAGNPQLTSALKEFAKKGNQQIFAVTTTPHASRHELSREVHRIGFHFPTQVVAQVCNHYGIRLTSGGKLVEEKDDDKLFMRLYQKGQLVLDEKVRDQVTINTEAKQIIQDLFPNIPDNDLFQIIKTAFQLGDGKVGTADEIPLVRRAQLAVVAHIRHTYTAYDKLLREVAYSEARHRVESITLQKLIDWRGDGHDDKQAMDDTLREVVVISDEEESDEVEEGQLLENGDLRVQPVRRVPVQRPITDGRPDSPIEIHSDDEAPRGYRYLPQVVRRYPVQDSQAISVARQQSRYAVWDRMRQEYRSGPAPATRVVERILIDESPKTQTSASYVSREPIYVPETSRRIVEPAVRIVSQPSVPTYVRGADGKLYERIAAQPEQGPPPISLRRLQTPPIDHGRQYIDSRQASPRPRPPVLHRRTESFENSDGTVLPSIEGPNGVYSPPGARRNPFEENRPISYQRNSGAFESNQRQGPIIDLTSSAEQASKRRKVEEAPMSPYLVRAGERLPNDHERNRHRADVSYQYRDVVNSSQPSRLIELENPAASQISSRAYERPESRPQQILRYHEEVNGRTLASPRSADVRQSSFVQGDEAHYTQSPRRIEYVNDYDRSRVRLYPAHMPGQNANNIRDHDSQVVLENLSLHAQTPGYTTEPAPRYVRAEVRNPFEAPAQSHYMPVERNRMEYVSLTNPSRETRLAHQTLEGAYPQSRMGPPPPSNVYR